MIKFLFGIVVGACLLLAMTLGFVVADHILPAGGTLVRLVAR